MKSRLTALLALLFSASLAFSQEPAPETVPETPVAAVEATETAVKETATAVEKTENVAEETETSGKETEDVAKETETESEETETTVEENEDVVEETEYETEETETSVDVDADAVLSAASEKIEAAIKAKLAEASATNDQVLAAIEADRAKWPDDPDIAEAAKKAAGSVRESMENLEKAATGVLDPEKLADRAIADLDASRTDAEAAAKSAKDDFEKVVWKKKNWLGRFTTFVDWVDDLVWGTTFTVAGFPVPCMILLILFGGILLTVRLAGMQFLQLPRALRYMVRNEEDGHGEVTSFAALCTALSATIGTGNIVGVATAVVAGGPGALFWMWLAALFGMATKYAEGLLAVKYRSHDPKTGHVLGGPFYYIERGMGSKWKPLAVAFAFFGALAGLLGIGTFTQVNSIAGAVTNYFDPEGAHTVVILSNSYSWMTVITSVALALVVGLVLIGGLKRIASVSEKLIPTMVAIYVVFALVLIACNVSAVPAAFGRIFRSAFGADTAGRAAFGGVVGAIVAAMQRGIARGIFSNEAGLGSAPIAAAAAQTKEPVRQGLVSMTGTFLDTIVVCSMTGLALVMAGFGSLSGNEAEGAAATMQAFTAGLPFLPPLFVKFALMVCLVLFGFTTILGWDYYSERCLEYLTRGNMAPVRVYRWLYILAVFIGPYMTISAVWGIADVFNGLMAIPNMIALIALSGVVAAETRSYFKRLKAGEIKE